MSNPIRPPDDIQIASMNVKKAAIRDPMAHGAGTPWEDRGSLGVAGAFFKTLGQSLFSSAMLLGSIRRPETFTDGKVFALTCGVLWGAGLAVQSLLWTHSASAKDYNINMTLYGVGLLIELVGAVVFTLIGLKLFASLFLKMIATDLKGRQVPQTLMQNLVAYAMGPAVLSVVPIAGPVVAGVWTFVNLIVAGTKRLQLSFSSTFIAVLISGLVVGGLAFVLHFGGWYLFNYVTGAYVSTKPATSFLGM